MTGIERLRALAYKKNFLEPAEARELDAIADQIERELTCDEDTIENVRLIVGGVVDDMERHVSGVEGMEDSPVARWARELREALGDEEHDLTDEDREAIAWVREHGGLGAVKEEWKLRSNLKRMCEKERAKVERQQRHIEHVQGVCKTRAHRIVELNKQIADMRPRLMPEGCDWEFLKLHMSNLRGFMLDVMDRLGVDKSDSDAPEIAFEALDRRLMPEGLSWPVFEDGAPVRFGDVVSDGDETGRVYYVTFDTVNSVIIGFTDETPDQDPGTWLEVSVSDGERVRRLAHVGRDHRDGAGERLRAGGERWRLTRGGRP